MKLNILRNKVSALPTIMGVNNDALVIKELMSVDYDEIAEEKELFCSILFDVHLSFTDTGFMDVN